LLSEVKKFLLRISAKDFTLKEIFFSKKWKFISYFVAVHGLKLERRNWEEQYKSMKAKFPISIF